MPGFGFSDFICGFPGRISSGSHTDFIKDSDFRISYADLVTAFPHITMGGFHNIALWKAGGGTEQVPMSYKLNLQPSWSQLSK